jgi:flagellar capping protein FliD
MARLEGAYEQISDRLNSIDVRLGSIETRIDQRFNVMEQRFNAMDQKFLWVIGLVLVSILLPLVQRFVPHG